METISPFYDDDYSTDYTFESLFSTDAPIEEVLPSPLGSPYPLLPNDPSFFNANTSLVSSDLPMPMLPGHDILPNDMDSVEETLSVDDYVNISQQQQQQQQSTSRTPSPQQHQQPQVSFNNNAAATTTSLLPPPPIMIKSEPVIPPYSFPSTPSVATPTAELKSEPSSSSGKRGRKRARIDTKVAQPVLPPDAELKVALSRQELVNISSEEFEAHIKKITQIRTLTAAEKAEVKRQRRLIKNRESAQASRFRKKQHITELESKVDTLVSSNATLKERYASLSTENRLLKSEVEFLTTLVNRIKVAS